MTRARQAIVALATLFVAAGCDDDPSGPEVLAAKQSSARALWNATRPTKYSFTASRSCECLIEAVGPVRIEIDGTSIVSVTRVDNGASVAATLWFDIDGLFDLIDTELAQRPSRLETEYSSQNGHPTYVEYGEREVDSGAIVTLSEFQVIGGTSGYLRR